MTSAEKPAAASTQSTPDLHRNSITMESERSVSEANSRFSLALLKKLSEDQTGNIFFSPFSISSALAMVLLGAAGNTATQMQEVLCLTEPETPPSEGALSLQTDRPYLMQSQMQTRRQMRTQIKSRLPAYLQKCLKPQEKEENVNSRFNELLTELSKPDALYALSIANRLYGEQTYTFSQFFLDETKKHYDSELEKVDFGSNAETSRININNWVEKQTQGKISDLLPSDAVGSSTKLVLVNAIYFKGKWDSQFEEEFTFDSEFRLNKTEKKPVKMMRQKHKLHFSYNEEINCKVLELPYKGEDLSMILLLPNDIEDDTTGLEKLEKELSFEKLKAWTGREVMGLVDVDVSLPRFRLEESYDLKKTLSSMGMEDAFDVSRSDFSGMSEANDLVLSAVVHKAFVEVNEEGTEAAASTAAVMVERSAMISEMFCADHPFLLFIRHNPSSTVLFAGRFCSPQ